jgi:hypothetical protein
MSAHRLRGGLLLAVCLLPVFLSANFVWRFGVDVPFWDEWELAPLLRALHDGQLSFAALAAQHNEHRLLFPRAVMLALAGLTRWNARAEMWFGWSLLCGMGLVLFLQHRRALGGEAGSSWLFAPLPWLVFTLRQSENLIWGWQLQIFMAAFALLLSMASLEHDGWGWFLAAIYFAVVSSFSFAAGLGVWPAGLLLIALGAFARGHSACGWEPGRWVVCSSWPCTFMASRSPRATPTPPSPCDTSARRASSSPPCSGRASPALPTSCSPSPSACSWSRSSRWP